MAVLGLDLGTSAVKALLLGEDGGVLAVASAPCAVDVPGPGRAEADPEGWLDAAAQAVRAALARAPAPAEPVRAVGLSGQMHGVVLAGADGRPVRPALVWPDQRAGGALGPWRALPPGRRRALGNPLAPGMAGPLLAWLGEHEPASLAAARWALQPKDWVRLRLCGEAATEPTDASATLLWDLPADGWAADIAAAAGIDPALLAPVRASCEEAGVLARPAAERLGLPEGVRVHLGAADTAAALLGAALAPGRRLLNVGTGAQLVVPADGPETAEAPRTHRYRAVEGFYAMGAVQNAGLAVEWALRTLGMGWEEGAALALGDPPPATGTLLFLPQLSGERTPFLDPGARGAWVGLGLEHGPAHLARAAFEGMACAVRAARDALADEAPPAAGEAPWRLLGGGGGTPGARRLLADALGAPVEVLEVRDASARGAALLAGAPAREPEVGEVIEPRPAGAEAAAERQERWERTVGALAAAR